MEIFASAGFVVARNAPFAGGYITQAYGSPRDGVQALQIEIDRGLYMDEARVEPLPEFGEVAGRIDAACRRLAELGPQAVPMAAE
jgi:N-formylglutamate deformylase